MPNYAADDIETVYTRIHEIRKAEEPRCPMSQDRTLHSCLRSSSRCGEECPNKSDWIGPQ